MLIKGFKGIENRYGTALGMIGVHQKSKIIVLPGVPKELKQMFKDEFIDKYIKMDKDSSIVTLKTTGITESKLYLILKDIIDQNKNNFKISFLPHFYGVNVRILKINNLCSMNRMITILKNTMKHYYYGQDEDSIESTVSQMLINNDTKISVAESCTGGLLSKKLTDFNGSSKYMIGSVVAYSNNIKNEILKVPKKILFKNGAVSAEVALSMSNNVTNVFNTDIGVSITGISGPTGGSNEKPVGLYFISIKSDKEHFYRKFIFNVNDRDLHREVAASTALNLIRLHLMGKCSE